MGRYMEMGPWSEKVPKRKGLDGKLLANGYRGILVVHRGDEKYITEKAYHIGVSWLSQQCCWSCRASRMRDSNMLYTHFGPNALHRQSLMDTAGFIQLCKPNAWVHLPGWSVEVLAYDLLHVFDLTLVPDAAASVLQL